MQDETGTVAGIGPWDDVPGDQDETQARAAAGLLGDDVVAENADPGLDGEAYWGHEGDWDWADDASWSDVSSDDGTFDVVDDESWPVFSGADDVGDDFATAAVIHPGESVTGSIDWAWDVDVWRIDLEAGKQYTFDLSGGDGLDGTYLALFDSTGLFVDYDMWGDGLAFSTETAGTYFLAASGDWVNAGGYDLSVTEGWDDADDSDPVSTVASTGSDDLYGTDGDDVIDALAGDDIVSGGAGADTLAGGAGDDIVLGDEGNDSIAGGAGDDVVFGDAGNDTLDGGAGSDLVFGDEGDDTIILGDLGDLDAWEEIDGGEGNDTLRLTGGGSLDLGYHGGWSIWSIETIDAGSHDVDILLDSWSALFTSGTDTLRIQGGPAASVSGDLTGAVVTSAAGSTTYSMDMGGLGIFNLVLDNALDRSGIVV